MINIIIPREENDPFYKKLKEMKKKKVLHWAKKHGCYEEAKKMYEVKEWLEKQIVY